MQARNKNGEVKRVNVGDHVEFKSDIEQGGKVIDITTDVRGRVVFTLQNLNGFQGEYLRGETITVELSTDCWF
jgi:hypothetical protein